MLDKFDRVGMVKARDAPDDIVRHAPLDAVP